MELTTAPPSSTVTFNNATATDHLENISDYSVSDRVDTNAVLDAESKYFNY